MTSDDRAARLAFREFVRAHHPDRGGDPDVFVAGLARLRAVPSAAPITDEPTDRARAPGAHRASRVRRPSIYKRRSLAHQVWADVLASLRSAVATAPLPGSRRVR